MRKNVLEPLLCKLGTLVVCTLRKYIMDISFSHFPKLKKSRKLYDTELKIGTCYFRYKISGIFIGGLHFFL